MIKLSLAQYVLLVFVAYQLYSAVSGFIRKKKIFFGMLWSLFFWLAAAAVIIFPNITQLAANFLGIGRGVDLMIYVALMAIFFFIFHLISVTQDHEHKITKLAREIALNNVKPASDKNSGAVIDNTKNTDGPRTN